MNIITLACRIDKINLMILMPWLTGGIFIHLLQSEGWIKDHDWEQMCLVLLVGYMMSTGKFISCEKTPCSLGKDKIRNSSSFSY